MTRIRKKNAYRGELNHYAIFIKNRPTRMGAWAGSCDGLLVRGFQMAEDVPPYFAAVPAVLNTVMYLMIVLRNYY
jgi:hypothetical protein